MLNRVLIIDPNQAEALMVLSRHLYAIVLREAIPFHKLTVRDPALALVVNEHFWNIYAQSTRMDLSLGMEMGGFDKPTTADYLYRMLSAMQTLAVVRPEQLDNRFRLGVAYRWNNDQEAAIATHQSLVKAIPAERRAGRAEALLQLAWSRINKVAWNRNFDDPDIRVAYQDADEALTLADLPLDKFMAEYTKAYSLLFTPDRDNRALLERLTEAKRWFAEIPGQTPDIWQFFIGAESLKAVLDADPIFQPISGSGGGKERVTVRARKTVAFLRRFTYLARPCSGSAQTHRICAFHPLIWPHRMAYSPSVATCDQNDCSKPTGTASFPGTTTTSPSCGGRPIPRTVLFPDKLHISRSLKRSLRPGLFSVTLDTVLS